MNKLIKALAAGSIAALLASSASAQTLAPDVVAFGTLLNTCLQRPTHKAAVDAGCRVILKANKIGLQSFCPQPVSAPVKSIVDGCEKEAKGKVMPVAWTPSK